MRRWSTFIAIVALFALMLPLITAAQTVAVPGPVTRHLSRTSGLPISTPYEIVNFVLDFAPGAWTPEHVHGGQLLVTVIEGQMTRRSDGAETVYNPGESWVEMPNHPHSAGNAGTVKAVVFVTALLPVGAALTTVSGTPSPNPPPGPVTRWIYRTPGWSQTGAFEIVQFVLDFAPGTQTPPHSHGGVVPFTTYEGTMTFSVQGHGTMQMPPGVSNTELPGHIAVASNETNGPVTALGSIVLPQGNAITYAVASFDDCSWYIETKQSLCFGFRAYWEKYGGLAIFGYPISAEMKDANGVTVQWFERARFEWHPGSWPERYDVLLGRVGVELAEVMGIGLTP
ncbi:MAG TPA: cupin domain-containing protein [Thermomicrobiales bacterium]|nr:cupin domain-containing protein [Thermomicrobiales bacterium]